MGDKELNDLAKKISFENLIKLNYFFKKKEFNSDDRARQNNSGKYHELKKLYYSDKDKLINYLTKKEEEINLILKEKNIESNIDFDIIAIKIFNCDYSTYHEFFKFNALAYKLALNKSIEEFKRDYTNEKYYLVDNVEIVLNFIEKLLFDFDSVYKENCSRRKKIMPGMELLPIYEETICGYMTSDFAKTPASIFVLRQIIELKIKRTLGFKGLIDKKKQKEKIVNISTLIDYIKEKETKGQIKSPVDIELLIAINRATNIYVHTGHFWNFMGWHEKIGQLFLRELCFKSNDKKTHVEGSFIMLESLFQNLENDLYNFFEARKTRNFEIKLEAPEVTIVDTI